MAKGKGGRPTLFTPELLETILDEISEGSTQRACFRVPGRPTWRAWCKWKRANPEFLPQLAQADLDWCEFKEEKVNSIALDESKDIHNYEERIESEKNGLTIKTGATTDNTSVQRHKLQIETITRMMKWKNPARYGDKIEQQLTGKDGESLTPILNITIAGPKTNG